MSLLDVGNALSAMNVAIDAAGPVATATGPTALAATQAVAAGVTTTQAYIASLPLGTSTYTLLQAQMLLANLQVIQANFATGQAPLTIKVPGGSSLFSIAAQYCGDASYARDIAAANGLSSVFIPVGSPTAPTRKTLIIPPFVKPTSTV